MAHTSPLTDLGRLRTNSSRCSATALLRFDELDGAVAIFMHVPVHKGGVPLAGFHIEKYRGNGNLEITLRKPKLACEAK